MSTSSESCGLARSRSTNLRATAQRSAVVFLLAAGLGVAQDSRPVKDVSDLLAPILARRDVPGMAAAAIRGNEIVMLGAAGLRRRGASEAVTRDDLWHLGSCTKAMTATLCATLVEEGTLHFDSTLNDVFSKRLEGGVPEPWRGATLAQLLTNSAGVPGSLDARGLWGELWAFRGTPDASRRALLSGVLRDPPRRVPGSTYEYSNGGFAIAGHMAETIAGKPFETLMREKLFTPLGMRSAGFGPPGTEGKVDQPHGHRSDGKPVAPARDADNPEAITPAGRVHSTISDWAKFVALHVRGGRGDAPPLKTETFAALHAKGSGRGAAYAMGWVLVERPWAGGTALTHGGSNTYWHCVAWLAPKEDFAVVVACNQGGDAGAGATDDAAGALIALLAARR